MMNETRFIHYKPIARRHMLEESAEGKGETTYSEKLTQAMRDEEIELLIQAVLDNHFPKAREHAIIIKEGVRLKKAMLYKFTDPEIKMVGYYNGRGILVSQRPMSRIEIAKLL